MSQASSHGNPSSSGLSNTDFLRSFLRDYRTIGAVRETSRGVARRICDLADIQNARHVAEFGCGTGPITREILNQLPDDGTLWGFEVHPPFVDHLKKAFDDPRFTLYDESALNLVQHQREQGLPPFDAIISTIPFSYLTREQTDDLLRTVVDAMADNARFVALQYHPTYLPPRLRRHFDSVSRDIYLWNLPPTSLFTATKPRRL